LLVQGAPSPFTPLVADLSLAINRYNIAVECGNSDDVASCYADIQKVLDLMKCECSCGCDDNNAPVWIDNSSQDGASGLTTLQDEIDTINATITSIQSSIATINSTLTTLQTTVNNLPKVYVAKLFSTVGSSTVGVEYVAANTLNLTAVYTPVSTGVCRLNGNSNQLPKAKTDVKFQSSTCANSPTSIEIDVESSNSSILITGYNGTGLSNGNINGILTITVYP
jgi:hypothetical protein